MSVARYEAISPTKRYRITNSPSRYGGTYERYTTEVKCCGRWLRCTGFTNTCHCGTDYNSAGQRLAPREQWGEETGEDRSG